MTMTEDIVQSDISTEFLSLVAIIFSIAAFYFYLQRLELPHLTDDSWLDQKHVPETKVTSTSLPFTITLKEHHQISASLTDGITISVETSVKSILQCFWAVECTRLTQVLRSCDRSHDSHSFEARDPLVLGEMLQEISHSMNTYFLGPNISKDVHLKMSHDETNSNNARDDDEKNIDLGPTPRSKYPLVVMVSRDDSHSRTGSRPVVIESIFWIFHLPDREVTTPCHVIGQLIITSRGQICDLQKVFVAANEEPANVETQALHRETQNRETNGSIEQDVNDLGINTSAPCPIHFQNAGMDRNCAVCQNAPITRAIIPCRHACVCSHCLALLSACPMCRGPIVSHFKFGRRSSKDEDATQGEDDSPVEENQDWVMKIQNTMERLNQLFSFM